MDYRNVHEEFQFIDEVSLYGNDVRFGLLAYVTQGAVIMP